MVDKEKRFIKHHNSCDMTKIEFSLNEVSVNINKTLLNKINRRNKK